MLVVVSSDGSKTAVVGCCDVGGDNIVGDRVVVENTLGVGMVLLLLIMLTMLDCSGPSWAFYLLRCDGLFGNLVEGVMDFVEIRLRTRLFVV